MKYNPAIHNRRSVRLKGYDYAQQGAYFITICCHNKNCLFGEIINGEMILNANGSIAYNEWLKTSEIRPHVELDVFVIMPNHIHGIIIIKNDDNRRGVSHPFTSIPNSLDQCRGVLHTPFSKSHPSENPDDLSHPSTSIPNSLDGCTGVLHTPRLITDEYKNHASNTPISSDSNKQSFIIQQGVCNTPLRRNHQINTFRSPSDTVGAMVRGYKSAVTKQMNKLNSGKYDQPSIVWQRSYYEHIIRNPQSYQNIADYIMNNPAKWIADTFHTI